MKIINTWLIVKESGLADPLYETEEGKYFYQTDSLNSQLTEITEKEAKRLRRKPIKLKK